MVGSWHSYDSHLNRTMAAERSKKRSRIVSERLMNIQEEIKSSTIAGGRPSEYQGILETE